MNDEHDVSTNSGLSVYPLLTREAEAFQAAADVLNAAEGVLACCRENGEIGEAEELQKAVRAYSAQALTTTIGSLSKFSIERIGAVCEEISRSCTADTAQAAMFRLRQAVVLLRDILERITDTP